MKPRTKLQKEVVKLITKLPSITAAQRKWAEKKSFTPEGFCSGKRVWCAECGNTFDAKSSQLSYSLLGTDCPCCGKHLEIRSSRKRKHSPQNIYFTIITTISGFQVLRHYLISKSCRIGQAAEFDITEVVQNWISPKGQEVIIARLTGFGFGAYDRWSLGSEMEVRSDCYIKGKYHIWSRHIKTISLLPGLRYIGFDDSYYGITPDILFKMLLRYPFVETLIKQGEQVLLEYMEDNMTKVGKYWNSIKIARRHGLKFSKRTDIRMYFDYLEMSDAIGRDMRSPKFLFPKNLKQAHDEVMKIKQKQDAKITLEKQREKALKNEARYQKQKGRFFGIAFGDGLIQIIVLQSVADFLEEGREMHHCIFTNDYFTKPDSLIMSARIDNKRVETVELNLKTLQVVQSRGVCNKNTEYHDRIVGLVRKNINLIRQKIA